jgi:hypothetical protein
LTIPFLLIVIHNDGSQLHNVLLLLQNIFGFGIPSHPKRSTSGSTMGTTGLHPNHDFFLLGKPHILLPLVVPVRKYGCLAKGFARRDGHECLPSKCESSEDQRIYTVGR